jgi:hypothetical protein
MKAIRAYVNGLKLPEIVRQLQSLGAKEMHIIEYYSVSPKISQMSFLCEDAAVRNACSVLCGPGATGTACDCLLTVTDVGPMTTGNISSRRIGIPERFGGT